MNRADFDKGNEFTVGLDDAMGDFGVGEFLGDDGVGIDFLEKVVEIFLTIKGAESLNECAPSELGKVRGVFDLRITELEFSVHGGFVIRWAQVA